jgi:hypothetical protein
MTMAKNPLNNVIFQDAAKARAWLEGLPIAIRNANC